MIDNISKILLFTFLCGFVNLAHSQEEESDRPAEIQNIIDNNQERFVFELTHDRAFGPDAPDVAPLSRGLNVYYVKNIPLGGASKFSVAPGLGLANRQIFMKNIYDFDAINGVASLPEVPEGLERNLSKLHWTYVEVPVELRWISNADKRGHSFKVATGFRAGYVIASKWKYNGQVFSGDFFELEPGDAVFTEKLKRKQLDNILPWRIAPGARIGYGTVNLFSYFQVNNDFDFGQGPDIKGFTVGASISSF